MTEQGPDEAAVYLVMRAGRGQKNPVHSVHRDAWSAIGVVFDELGDRCELRTIGRDDHAAGTVFVAYHSGEGEWWSVERKVLA